MDVTNDFVSLTVTLPRDKYDYIVSTLESVEKLPPGLDVSAVCSNILISALEVDKLEKQKRKNRRKRG